MSQCTTVSLPSFFRPAADAAERSGGGGSAVPPQLAGHVPALDGLRGLAILLVAANHFFTAAQSNLSPAVVKFVHSGWVGVDLFFVLSGFLITGILWDSRGTPHYFRNFYARRALRIFPLYYAAVFGVVVVLPLALGAFASRGGGFVRLGAEVQSIQDRQAWLWAYGSNVLQTLRSSDWSMAGHFWSLAVEEHFYLVWPAALLLFAGRRGAMFFCAAVAATALALRVAVVTTAFDTFNVYFLTFCRMDSLAVGGFIALAARGAGGLAPLIKPAKGVAIGTGTALLVWMIARGGLENHQDPLMQSVGFTVVAAFFAAVLLIVVAARPAGPTGRVFASPVLRWFGKYSYGLYVFHHLILFLTPLVLPSAKLREITGSTPLAALASIAINAALSIVAAYLSWHLYEKWFLRLKRFFHTQPVRTAAGLDAQPAPLAA